MKFIIALLLLLSLGFIVMVRTSRSKDAHESYERWKERHGHGKSEYCIAEQLGTVCYHMSKDMCQRCKQAEEDKKDCFKKLA